MITEIDKYWHEKGHFNFNQRDYFIQLLTNLQPKTILEIGWATGRSCITALVAAKPEKMISVDIDLDYMNAKEHAAVMTEAFPNLKIIEGDSKKVLSKHFFQAKYPQGIDFAFIDGEHTFTGAYRDISRVWKHINKGGVMAIDDYRSGEPDGVYLPEVEKAVDLFVQKKKLTIETWNVDGKGFAIIKK